MAQQYLEFNTYQAPPTDEDGYSPAFAVTSTAYSGRVMRGSMINVVMFTVEAYNLKWTDISAKDVSNILKQCLGKKSFSFHHFNVYESKWETSDFYVSNINAPMYNLTEGDERVNELSFQVTAINPLDTE